MGRRRFPASGRSAILVGVQTPDAPLVLKAQGSFFVGREKAEQTQVELGGLGPGGHITVNHDRHLDAALVAALQQAERGKEVTAAPYRHHAGILEEEGPEAGERTP